MARPVRECEMFRIGLVLQFIFIVVGGCVPVLAQGGSFEKDVIPFLRNYCMDCHDADLKKGDLDLEPFKTAADVVKGRKLWDSVLFQIDNHTMPPAKKEKQPTIAERDKMVGLIDNLLYPVDPTSPDPGRVTIRRLNRVEYNNTIRDLIGIDMKLADTFPEDDSGYGFDNIGDVLALPPVLMERYLQAADRILEKAIVAVGASPHKDSLPLGKMKSDTGKLGGDSFMFYSNGEGKLVYDFPADASYVVRVKAWGEQAGNEPTKMQLSAGGEKSPVIDVKATQAFQQNYEARLKVKKGSQTVSVSFLNDFNDKGKDRNLWIGSLEIEEPFMAEGGGLPESHRRIFIQDKGTDGTEAASRKILNAFCNRAFRRPARKEEVDRLYRIVQAAKGGGEGWEESIRIALKAALVSPYFLYRIEWQPEPNNPNRIVEINEFSLASRLSYFLWSSMPDDELLSLAFKNQLRANLPAQVTRMLKEAKSRALAENFVGQWLEIRNLNGAKPDSVLFGSFDSALKEAMRHETEEVFLSILRENKSVMELLSADYTFVNDRLAKHYGMPVVSGSGFQKVSLAGTNRRGILTHGSVLTVTSDPTRTSPVKRGKWVMENILGTPPPPPPPNVPTLESSKQLTGSLRQRMEQHRNNPACASCHSLLDPIGFGLENFDAIGRWREKDGEFPVEAAGRLTTGQEFKSAGELTSILLKDRQEAFLKCVVQKTLTYSLGRGLEFYDKTAVNEIVSKTKAKGLRFQDLILAVVESVPFQKRRGDGFRPAGK